MLRERASRGNPPGEGRTETGSSATVPRGYDTLKERLPTREDRVRLAGASCAHAHAREERVMPPPPSGWRRRTKRPAGRGLRQDRRAGQRERERERDASATLTRPIKDPPRAQRLSTALFPKKTTRTTSPSQLRPGPSPQVPSKALAVDQRSRPKPVLCFVTPRRPQGHRDNITVVDPASLVK